jgi:hypothetical protein
MLLRWPRQKEDLQKDASHTASRHVEKNRSHSDELAAWNHTGGQKQRCDTLSCEHVACNYNYGVVSKGRHE